MEPVCPHTTRPGMYRGVATLVTTSLNNYNSDFPPPIIGTLGFDVYFNVVFYISTTLRAIINIINYTKNFYCVSQVNVVNNSFTEAFRDEKRGREICIRCHGK